MGNAREEDGLFPALTVPGEDQAASAKSQTELLFLSEGREGHLSRADPFGFLCLPPLNASQGWQEGPRAGTPTLGSPVKAKEQPGTDIRGVGWSHPRGAVTCQRGLTMGLVASKCCDAGSRWPPCGGHAGSREQSPLPRLRTRLLGKGHLRCVDLANRAPSDRKTVRSQKYFGLCIRWTGSNSSVILHKLEGAFTGE